MPRAGTGDRINGAAVPDRKNNSSSFRCQNVTFYGLYAYVYTAP